MSSPAIKQAVIDGATAGGTLSMPLWVQGLEGWLQLILYIGGVALLLFRIYLAWREHQRKPIPKIVQAATDIGDP